MKKTKTIGFLMALCMLLSIFTVVPAVAQTTTNGDGYEVTVDPDTGDVTVTTWFSEVVISTNRPFFYTGSSDHGPNLVSIDITSYWDYDEISFVVNGHWAGEYHVSTEYTETGKIFTYVCPEGTTESQGFTVGWWEKLEWIEVYYDIDWVNPSSDSITVTTDLSEVTISTNRPVFYAGAPEPSDPNLVYVEIANWSSVWYFEDNFGIWTDGWNYSHVGTEETETSRIFIYSCSASSTGQQGFDVIWWENLEPMEVHFTIDWVARNA